MDAYLSRQLPVITTCIEFSQKNLGPTPIITPQIDFAHNASKNLLVEDEDVGMMEGDTVDALLEKTPDHDDTLDILAHLMKNPTKIPKPIGEPGRPRSGGYCLEAALGNWGDELFHAVNVRLLLSDIYQILINSLDRFLSRERLMKIWIQRRAIANKIKPSLKQFVFRSVPIKNTQFT